MKIILKILRKMRFSTIRTKIAAIISILIALISLFIFAYFPAKLEKQAIKAISDKARSIAEITALNVGPALFFEDMPNIGVHVKSARQNRDLAYIIIANNSGKILSSLNKNEAERVNYTEILNGNGLSADGTTYKVIIPITLDNQNIGRLYMGLSLKGLKSETNKSRINIALASLLIFFIGMLATFAVTSVLTNSLTKMVKTVKQISKGDLTQRANISSQDEAGQLASAFNKMVDNLETAYRELENMNFSLEKRVDELNMFLATISHDLKNPLVGLQLVSGMLIENYGDNLDELGKSYIKRIQINTEYIGRLLDNLMELSRLERTKSKIETVNISEVIHKIINEFSPKLEEHGTKVFIGNEMPVIQCDYQRISSVFANLIDNANKFMGEDNGNPRIEIGHEIQDGYYVFHIKDNGIGIQKDYHEKIFQVFQRLDQKTEGTGVGLAIVKRIVENFGGKVWLDSDIGKGATFYFTIPK